jgi:hypothetical protein
MPRFSVRGEDQTMITRAATRRQFLREVQQSEEPVGIVIADGGPVETRTRFLAYVWGAAPSDDELRWLDESSAAAPLS